MASNTSINTARTQGDGMENDKTNEFLVPSSSKMKLPHHFEIERLLPKTNTIYRPTESSSQLPITVPRGKIFNLIPKLVHSERNVNSLKSREPRFIPFEPYKAAVNPIFPNKSSNRIKISNKNNLDLNVLVSQMSTVTSKELGNKSPQEIIDSEKVKYERQIEELKKERDYFQGQLKFQAQVNSELKSLLVAAVGEDIQTKVNVLTEDKLFLARELLNSAKNLSSHNEQIEYLAGQSEVWRSKFLASSLMVEELARWKASLLQKNHLLLQSNKAMLELTSKVREMQMEILKNLKFISNTKKLELTKSDILELTAESLNISQQLILEHSAMGQPDNLNLDGLEYMTSSEKMVIEALQNSNQQLIQTDEPLRAIVGQAFPSINSMRRQQKTESVEILHKNQLALTAEN